MPKNNSRADQLAADQKMIDGIKKNQAKLPPSFPVGGAVTTPAEVITVYEDRIAKGKAVVDAESAKAAALKADGAARAASQSKVATFKRLVIAMFLESPDVLGDFGLTAPKPPARTAAAKAVAAVKGMATRKLLGTKGSRQKKVVLASAGAPVAAPATPAVVPPQPVTPAASPAASPAPAAAPAAQPAPAVKPVS
jgi:hypothetical protein